VRTSVCRPAADIRAWDRHLEPEPKTVGKLIAGCHRSQGGGAALAEIAAFFGAAAALAAALFSGVSLYLSGKREERRWRRDVLLSAYQRMIELSFDRSLRAVKGIDTRQGIESFVLNELREEEYALHLEYDSMLTRVRLLAAANVVAAAEKLHLYDNELVELADLKTDQKPSETDVSAFEGKREQNRRAKQHMLSAARATLGLDPAAPIGDSYWEPLLRSEDQS
jgi:hypothetical protein